MTEASQALLAANQMTWDAIASRRDKLQGRAISVPVIEPMQEASLESRFSDDFAVLSYLDQALSMAGDTELADVAAELASVVGELRWSQNPSYNESNCALEFLNGYAYAAFSGPDAPIRCSVPRGGLFLMAPELTYPGHNHEPREVYLILTPGAQWRLDDGDWFDVMPGDLIFHDSWQVHSMRTGKEPLLAFAGWIESGERKSIGWTE